MRLVQDGAGWPSRCAVVGDAGQGGRPVRTFEPGAALEQRSSCFEGACEHLAGKPEVPPCRVVFTAAGGWARWLPATGRGCEDGQGFTEFGCGRGRLRGL
jgi:hypothetical protein